MTTADRAAIPACNSDPTIQFYAIEMCPTADGMIFVGVGATVCEIEGELSHMDMGNQRFASIDDALAFIRQTVSAH